MAPPQSFESFSPEAQDYAYRQASRKLSGRRITQAGASEEERRAYAKLLENPEISNNLQQTNTRVTDFIDNQLGRGIYADRFQQDLASGQLMSRVPDQQKLFTPAPQTPVRSVVTPGPMSSLGDRGQLFTPAPVRQQESQLMSRAPQRLKSVVPEGPQSRVSDTGQTFTPAPTRTASSRNRSADTNRNSLQQSSSTSTVQFGRTSPDYVPGVSSGVVTTGEGLRFVSDFELREFRQIPTPSIRQNFFLRGPLNFLSSPFQNTKETVFQSTGIFGFGTGRTILEERQRRVSAITGDSELSSLNAFERRQVVVKKEEEEVINQFQSQLNIEQTTLQRDVSSGILSVEEANRRLSERQNALQFEAQGTLNTRLGNAFNELERAERAERGVSLVLPGETGRDATTRISKDLGKRYSTTAGLVAVSILTRSPAILITSSAFGVGSGSLKVQEAILNSNLRPTQRLGLAGLGVVEAGLGLVGIRTAIGPQTTIINGQRVGSSLLARESFQEALEEASRARVSFKVTDIRANTIGDIATTRVTTIGGTRFPSGQSKFESVADIVGTSKGPRVLTGQTTGEVSVRGLFGDELKLPINSKFQTSALDVEEGLALLGNRRVVQGTSTFGRIDIQTAGKVNSEKFFGVTTLEDYAGIPGKVTRVGRVEAQRIGLGSPRNARFNVEPTVESLSGTGLGNPVFEFELPTMVKGIKGRPNAFGFEPNPTGFDRITIPGAVKNRVFRQVAEPPKAIFGDQVFTILPQQSRLSPNIIERPITDIPTITGGQGGQSLYQGLGLEVREIREAVQTFSQVNRNALGVPGSFAGQSNIQSSIASLSRDINAIRINRNPLLNINPERESLIRREIINTFDLQPQIITGSTRQGLITNPSVASVNYQRLNLGQVQLSRQSNLQRQGLVQEQIQSIFAPSPRVPRITPRISGRFTPFGFASPRIPRLDTGFKLPQFKGSPSTGYSPSITGAFLGLTQSRRPNELSIGGFNPFQIRGLIIGGSKMKSKKKRL